MVYEIGRFKGKVVEKEYPIDNYRLDVVWKRIVKGNPYRAFEVQIGRNFFEALTKLKQAWDMWNSTPYLVTTDACMEKAKQLVEGSFHEMGKACMHASSYKGRFLGIFKFVGTIECLGLCLRGCNKNGQEKRLS